MKNVKFIFSKSTYNNGYNDLLSACGYKTIEELKGGYSKFHIHHIDHNRSNNHYTNLVKVLDFFHVEYHSKMNSNLLKEYCSNSFIDIKRDDVWDIYWKAINDGKYHQQHIQKSFFDMERIIRQQLPYFVSERDAQHNAISNFFNYGEIFKHED